MGMPLGPARQVLRSSVRSLNIGLLTDTKVCDSNVEVNPRQFERKHSNEIQCIVRTGARHRGDNSIAPVADGFPGDHDPACQAQVTLTGLPGFPLKTTAVHFTWLLRLLGLVYGEVFLMIRGPDRPASRASSGPEEPTPTARIQALLDHIRALDQSMDEARLNKIENIKKALADGTYHVSAAEVARKIIDNLREP
jgi:hypothetical protein